MYHRLLHGLRGSFQRRNVEEAALSVYSYWSVDWVSQGQYDTDMWGVLYNDQVSAPFSRTFFRMRESCLRLDKLIEFP